jgi:hypothetical protein
MRIGGLVDRAISGDASIGPVEFSVPHTAHGGECRENRRLIRLMKGVIVRPLWGPDRVAVARETHKKVAEAKPRRPVGTIRAHAPADVRLVERLTQAGILEDTRE